MNTPCEHLRLATMVSPSNRERATKYDIWVMQSPPRFELISLNLGLFERVPNQPHVDTTIFGKWFHEMSWLSAKWVM